MQINFKDWMFAYLRKTHIMYYQPQKPHKHDKISFFITYNQQLPTYKG